MRLIGFLNKSHVFIAVDAKNITHLNVLYVEIGGIAALGRVRAERGGAVIGSAFGRLARFTIHRDRRALRTGRPITVAWTSLVDCGNRGGQPRAVDIALTPGGVHDHPNPA